jgi:hypothetical protein
VPLTHQKYLDTCLKTALPEREANVGLVIRASEYRL